MMKLTPQQREVMEYALGIYRVPGKTTPHRNYLLADPDHPDLGVLQECVYQGWMIRREPNLVVRFSTFIVTELGAVMLGLDPASPIFVKSPAAELREGAPRT